MSQKHKFSIPSPYQAFCYNRWFSGHGLEMHYHDCLQIFHVLEGDFYVDCGSGWQRIKEGNAHILPPGNRHALRTEKGDTHFSLTFHVDNDERGLIRRICESFPEPAQAAVALPGSMRTFLDSPPLLFDDLAQLHLFHLFDGYCLNLLDSRKQGESEIKRQKLLAFLEVKSAESLTVEEIAVEMQMSRAGVQRFCTEFFGCGVRTLHERIRIENASHLLLQNDIKVSDCAYKCGYTDIYAFSRSFKRVKGRSPQNFRHFCQQSE